MTSPGLDAAKRLGPSLGAPRDGRDYPSRLLAGAQADD